jgi:hypothetical protein
MIRVVKTRATVYHQYTIKKNLQTCNVPVDVIFKKFICSEHHEVEVSPESIHEKHKNSNPIAMSDNYASCS